MADWQRASYCGDGGNNCVELGATADGRIRLRESEAPETVVAVSPGALRGFLAVLKAAQEG